MIEALFFSVLIIAGLIVHNRDTTKERDDLRERIKEAERNSLMAPSKAAEDFLAIAPKFIHETVSRTTTKKSRTVRELSLLNREDVEQYEVITQFDTEGRFISWSRDYGSGRKHWIDYIYAPDGKTAEDLEYGFDGHLDKRILRRLDERGRTLAILRFNAHGEHTHTSEFSFDHLGRKIRETVAAQYVIDRRTSKSLHISKAATLSADQIISLDPDYWIYHYADDNAKHPFLEEGFNGKGTLKSTIRHRYDELGRLQCTEGPYAKTCYRFYQLDALEPCMLVEVGDGSQILPRLTLTITQYEYLKEGESR